eukprot:m.351966 g.351966  ORF g.351966 m.351966 type:complete len:60 (+) comp16414_c0_seq1:1481-1660(+)
MAPYLVLNLVFLPHALALSLSTILRKLVKIDRVFTLLCSRETSVGRTSLFRAAACMRLY